MKATNKFQYETSEVNREFLIRAYDKANGLNTLLGVSGLISLIGMKNANNFVKRAFASMTDKYSCKVYGGAIITFVRH